MPICQRAFLRNEEEQFYQKKSRDLSFIRIGLNFLRLIPFEKVSPIKSQKFSMLSVGDLSFVDSFVDGGFFDFKELSSFSRCEKSPFFHKQPPALNKRDKKDPICNTVKETEKSGFPCVSKDS